MCGRNCGFLLPTNSGTKHIPYTKSLAFPFTNNRLSPLVCQWTQYKVWDSHFLCSSFANNQMKGQKVDYIANGESFSVFLLTHDAILYQCKTFRMGLIHSRILLAYTKISLKTKIFNTNNALQIRNWKCTSYQHKGFADHWNKSLPNSNCPHNQLVQIKTSYTSSSYRHKHTPVSARPQNAWQWTQQQTWAKV